ncbi:hypothetical protein F511_37075 [Dorcoceras hygrometricum]|uniref:Splicing factor 3B subunit 1-like n=1 Tax=Dorcoceras hygrometricum TaxID=472368 RepID=A0A2Z7CA48_9LAMI|nr:hypothetical protein F511_37075 [Dorcoceras hygrometricum]
MVTPSSKQAKGFASQICVLQKGALDLTLGEANTFPPLKIHTIKSVGTYVAKNKYITAEEVTVEPPVEKVVKKAAAKRRPAPAAEPVSKRKRTILGKAAPTEKNLVIVPVVQDPEPISVVPAESPSVQRRRGPKRKLILQRVSDDEKSDEEVTAVVETEETTYKEVSVEKETTKEIGVTAGMETVETESRIDVSAITNYDVVISFKVLSNEEGPLVEKEKEEDKKNDETEEETSGKGKRVDKIIDSEDTEPLSKVLELIETSMSDEESMSIDDLLQQIPEDMMIPYVTAEEPTKIKSGRGIMFKEISVPPVVHPSTEFIADIPQISMPTAIVPSADYTESFAKLRASIDQIKLEQLSTLDGLDKLKAALSGKITNLEVAFAQTNTCQESIFRNLIYGVRQEIKTQKASLSQDLNEFRKETQAGIDTLTVQFSEIIAYIDIGRDDKKGEESSRGPSSDDRSRPGGGGSRPGEGGSRSEPPKRGGGSNRGSGSYRSGRGSKSSGWSRWFG